MKNTLGLFAITIILSLFACKEKETKTRVEESAPKVESTTDHARPTNAPALSPFPAHLFKPVYMEADYMDVIFEELPFSMSQDNNNSIRQILNYIDVNAPENYNANCPLFGQLLVQKEAEYIMEANIYHSEGCYYWLIKHQGEKYVNGMTDAGIQFFNQLKQRKF